MVMKQEDIAKVRNSVGQQLGSKVMIKLDKGRHRVDVQTGVIKAAYPNIFTIEVESGPDNEAPRVLSFSYKDVITRDVRMMLC
ncbi:Uncharacterized protein Veg [Acetitomaculum ruminis DSM 5522]|uniref:Uncharacterized protein Veg n=1 Tax=Acetitomaculum ruminis DSM 5522 TaxID=1120918 RepID=A0A1I0YEC9_9FIRM|nr:Veg family protein [Acetitomaculum ruminis]SFB10583.1 Uncharacterized protein Veg [Acetitomaculum ruminis DSM 5522]